MNLEYRFVVFRNTDIKGQESFSEKMQSHDYDHRNSMISEREKLLTDAQQKLADDIRDFDSERALSHKEHEKKLGDVQEKLDAEMEKNNVYKTKLKALRVKYQESRTTLDAETEEQMKTLQDKLDASFAENNELEMRAEQYVQEFDNAQRDTQNVHKSIIDELNGRLVVSEQAVESHRMHLETLREEEDTLRTSLSQDFESQLAALRQHLDETVSENEMYETRETETLAETEETRTKNQRVYDENINIMKEKLIVAQTLLEQHKKKALQLKEQADQNHASLQEQSHAVMYSLQERLDEALAENVHYGEREASAKIETETSRLSTQESHESSIADMNKRLEDAQSALDSHRKRLDTLHQEGLQHKQKAEDILFEHQSFIERSDRQSRQLREALEKSEHKYNELHAKVATTSDSGFQNEVKITSDSKIKTDADLHAMILESMPAAMRSDAAHVRDDIVQRVLRTMGTM
jgi:chromosome segregation ATPase